MILPLEVREQLKARRGIYLTEACDACGALLGAVRYTRRGESGAWCSAKCRDGAEAIADGVKRRSGRPRKYESESERMAANRVKAAKRQRAFRERLRVTQNPLAAD